VNVYLVRHSRPALEGARCYGRLEAGLPPGWKDQVANLQIRLPADAALVCSPDLRCRELAELLALRSGVAPLLDERLLELDFGAWEGIPWADIPHAESVHWAKDLWNRSPPGGETYAALYARVSAAWQSLIRMDTDTVTVIGNAGPLRALLTIALELPRDAFVRIHLDYASMTLLSDASGGWRLEFANR
jgi:alpha-ribazole phosphatase